MKKSLLLTFFIISLTTNEALADLQIKGFGSIVAGSVIKGDGYIADYPNLGVYENKFDVSQETRLGLQAKAQIDDKLAATVQVMTRSANDYDPEVEWLYASYKINSDNYFQIGRMRMPVYYYSDFMDVGYAYPWLRIPADTYSLDITNFNGIKINTKKKFGDLFVKTTLYTGQEKNQNDELMSYLFESFTTNIDRQFDNIFGVVLDTSINNVTLRATYTQSDMIETQTYGDGSDGDVKFDIEFYDIFLKYDFETGISVMAEYNKYKPFYESYFGSIIYQVDDISYYLSLSKFDLDTPFEEHDTISVGLRYDFSSYAIKFDISTMNDNGFNPFTGQSNPVYHKATDDGDVTTASISLDFVF